MAKKHLFLLPVVLGAALACAQTAGPILGGPDPAIKASVVGSPLACSQSQTFFVSAKLAPRAKIKARLITLLRESLFDDAKGLVNIARENEIKKLANELKSPRE